MQPPSPSTDPWERLATESGVLPTQDLAWNRASLATFRGAAATLRVGPDREPRAIAPLVRRGGMLELAGVSEGGGFSDLLAHDEPALAELSERIAAEGRLLFLERIPAASPTPEALREALDDSTELEVNEEYASSRIVLGDERWLEPGGGLKSRRRSALRRARRIADEEGEVSIEQLTPEPDELEPLLDRAFAIERRSWKGEVGTAIVQMPRHEAFLRRYGRELAARGDLRVELLSIAGKGVAMLYGCRWGNRHWLFKIGYDAAHSAASPGQLLLAESVAVAAREGLDSYELFGARDTWTDVWANELTECVRVTAIPKTARGAHGRASLWRQQKAVSAAAFRRRCRRAAKRLLRIRADT